MMPINFRQLEVFCAVAKMQSFTRASHGLFISQSTVSQHVREMEDSLGVKLFHRNQRNVSLTMAGENLMERARTIFQLLEEAETAAKTTTDPYRGKVSFGCASTTLLYHLPSILLDYTQKYPNVELNITGGTIQEIGPQIWSGALDLALVVLPLSSPAMETVVVVEESFAGIISAKHRLADRPSLNVSDVAGERFILPRKGQNTRKLIDRYLFKQRITPQVAIELAETEAIKAMVARGLGVSILPESALLSNGDREEIRTFRISRKDLKRSLAVVYPKPRALRPPALALVELLQKHFRTRQRA